jgi:hypothetical protein
VRRMREEGASRGLDQVAEGERMSPVTGPSLAGEKGGAIGWLPPVSDRGRRGAGAVERGGLEIRCWPCHWVPSFVGMWFVSASWNGAKGYLVPSRFGPYQDVWVQTWVQTRLSTMLSISSTPLLGFNAFVSTRCCRVEEPSAPCPAAAPGVGDKPGPFASRLSAPSPCDHSTRRGRCSRHQRG